METANKLRPLSISKTILFSLLPAFLLFGFTELGLRLFYQPAQPSRFHGPHAQSIEEFDAELGYKLKPNFTGVVYASQVVTNNLGFRGPDFEPAKADHKRIVALGDSCTFGFGASDNKHTFPARLEALFDESGERAEVINAGNVGYNSWQAYQFLRRDIVAFKPQIVLVYVGWNDMGNSLRADWKPNMVKGFEPGKWNQIVGSLYLYKAMSDVIERLRLRGNREFKVAAIEVYANNLANIIQVARERGIEPVILTWPTRLATEIEHLRNVMIPITGVTFGVWFDIYQKYQNAMLTVARQHGVRIVDLAQAFASDQTAALYYDDIHLSDTGNQKAAQIIFNELSTVSVAH